MYISDCVCNVLACTFNKSKRDEWKKSKSCKLYSLILNVRYSQCICMPAVTSIHCLLTRSVTWYAYFVTFISISFRMIRDLYSQLLYGFYLNTIWQKSWHAWTKYKIFCTLGKRSHCSEDERNNAKKVGKNTKEQKSVIRKKHHFNSTLKRLVRFHVVTKLNESTSQ